MADNLPYPPRYKFKSCDPTFEYRKFNFCFTDEATILPGNELYFWLDTWQQSVYRWFPQLMRSDYLWQYWYMDQIYEAFREAPLHTLPPDHIDYTDWQVKVLIPALNQLIFDLDHDGKIYLPKVVDKD